MASIRSVGTVSASPNNVAASTNLAPGLPATRVNGDMLLLFTSCRLASPGSCATPSGWTSLANITGTNGHIYLFGRRVDGAETAPTVAWTALTSGTSGGAVQAQIAAVNGVITTGTVAASVDVLGAAGNQAASTTAASGGAAITTLSANALVFVFSSRQDDAGTWATLAVSDTVTWAKVGATSVTTSGLDHAQEWQWGVRAAAGSVAAKTFTLTGGSSFASSGVMLAFKAAPVPTITPEARVSLASGGAPVTQTAHKIKLRARKVSGTTVKLNAALYEGSTNRTGNLLTTGPLTTSLADYTLAVPDTGPTGIGADKILSYADLELRIWADSPDADAGALAEVAKASLETPAAALPLVESTIDNFNRADGLVSAGAGGALWNQLQFDGSAGPSDLRVISNRLGKVASSPVYQSAYTKVEVDNGSGDCDVLIDCGVIPVTPNFEFSLHPLYTNPGGTFNSYAVIWANGTWILRRYAAGASAGNLNTNAVGGLAVGDTIWFSKRGSALKVYKKPSGGNYQLILSATDANHNPATGFVAVEISDTTQRWDDLRGGPLVVAGTPWDPGVQAEALGITDSVSMVIGHGETPADALSVVDVPFSVGVFNVDLLSDALGMTDARALAVTEALADAAGIADSTAQQAGKGQALSDPVALTDARALDVAELIADPVAMADSQALVAVTQRAFADPLGLTDAQVLDRAGLIADPVALADAPALLVTFVRAQADLLGLADAPALLAVLERSVADPLTLGDLIDPQLSVGAVAHSVPLADLLGLTDGALLEAGRFVGVADPIGLTDSAGLTGVYTRAFADPLGLVDAAVLLGAYQRSLADPLGLGDLALPVAVSARTLADLLGVTDQAVPLTGYFAALADQLGVADVEAFLAVYARSLADLIGVTDFASSGAQAQVTLGDLLGMTDQAGVLSVYARTLLEPLALSDAADTALARQLALADPLGLADGASALIVVLVQLGDQLGVADSTVRTAALTRALADPLDLTDAQALTAALLRTLTDAASLTDSASGALGRALTLPDALGVGDLLAFEHGAVLSLADLLALQDALALAQTATRLEALGLTDLALPVLSHIPTVVVSRGLTVVVSGPARAGVTAVAVGGGLLVTVSAVPRRVSVGATGRPVRVGVRGGRRLTVR